MSIRRHKHWYVATIGGLSACSFNRQEALNLVVAMFEQNTKKCPP